MSKLLSYIVLFLAGIVVERFIKARVVSPSPTPVPFEPSVPGILPTVIDPVVFNGPAPIVMEPEMPDAAARVRKVEAEVNASFMTAYRSLSAGLRADPNNKEILGKIHDLAELSATFTTTFSQDVIDPLAVADINELERCSAALADEAAKLPAATKAEGQITSLFTAAAAVGTAAGAV